MIKVISTVDSSVPSFLRFLALLVYSYESDLSYEMKNRIDDILVNSEEFLTQFKFRKPLIIRIATTISQGWSVSERDTEMLGRSLKSKHPVFMAELSISPKQVAFIKDVGNYLRTDSESAYKRLVNNMSIIADNEITKLFTLGEIESQAPEKNRMKEIVKKFTRRNDHVLTPDERREVSVKSPNEYKEYLSLSRKFLGISKTALKNIIRESSVPYLDIKEVLTIFKGIGIEHKLPTKFVGKIDEDGNLYTTDGKAIDGKPSSTLVMNPKYDSTDSTSVFKAKPYNSELWQRYYTFEYKKRRKQKKFENIGDLTKNIKMYARKWRSAMNSSNDRDMALGTIVETLYQTAARVGTRGNDTFGIATLLRKHIEITGNRLRIRYIGKKNAKQDHIIKATDKHKRRLLENYKYFIEGIESHDPIFVVNGKEIKPSQVNKFLRGVVGYKGTSHNFRALRGTVLMNSLIIEAGYDKIPETPINQKEFLDWFKKATEKVGKILNHTNKTPDGGSKVTGATAVKYYIDPALTLGLFRRNGMRLPPSLLKLKLIANSNLKVISTNFSKGVRKVIQKLLRLNMWMYETDGHTDSVQYASYLLYHIIKQSNSLEIPYLNSVINANRAMLQNHVTKFSSTQERVKVDSLRKSIMVR